MITIVRIQGVRYITSKESHMLAKKTSKDQLTLPKKDLQGDPGYRDRSTTMPA
jgi:hypothetical protein